MSGSGDDLTIDEYGSMNHYRRVLECFFEHCVCCA